MSDKPKITVYLSGPIIKDDESCKVWRRYIIDKMPEINFIDPSRVIYKDIDTEETATLMVETDKQDIRDSNVVLVNPDRPTVGTSMEVLYTWELGIYVLVIWPKDKIVHPWIRYHSSKIVSTLDEAIEELKTIESQFTEYEVDGWDDGL